jgi:hypothetical protein
MSSARWSGVAPGNPQGLSLGQEGLQTFGFYSSRAWIWAGERDDCMLVCCTDQKAAWHLQALLAGWL